MSMIDFIKKHEKVLTSGRDSHRQKLTSLKSRLDELQSIQPDYQKIANEIYDRLESEDLLPKADGKPKLGDKVIGIGEFFGKNIDGLLGEVVEEPRNPSYNYGVEWEERVGRSKGSGVKIKWRVPRRKLRKISTFQKPEVSTKKDYDDFLAKLTTTIEEKSADFEEYLDHDDKDFKNGDEVVTVVEFPMVEKGTRGVIKRKVEGHRNSYQIDTAGEENYFYADSLAKVKKKRKEIKVGDKVKITNPPDSYGSMKDGDKGVVDKDLNSLSMIVSMYTLRGEEVEVESRFAVGKAYLRLDTEKIDLVVRDVEEEFNLPAYEIRRLELSYEISELIGREGDEMKEFFELDALADLELEYIDLEKEQELEDLLK